MDRWDKIVGRGRSHCLVRALLCVLVVIGAFHVLAWFTSPGFRHLLLVFLAAFLGARFGTRRSCRP